MQFWTKTTYSIYPVRTTVLGRKKRLLKTPHKSTSLPPIPKIFFLETFYISTKLRKKFQGAPPKITPHFLDFSKKSRSQKTRFCPLGRNFDHRFRKRPKIVDFWGPRPRKFFSTNFRCKNPHTPKNLFGTLRIDILRSALQKAALIFLCQILAFWGKLQQKLDFSNAINYSLAKLQQESEKQDVKITF